MTSELPPLVTSPPRDLPPYPSTMTLPAPYLVKPMGPKAQSSEAMHHSSSPLGPSRFPMTSGLGRGSKGLNKQVTSPGLLSSTTPTHLMPKGSRNATIPTPLTRQRQL